MARGGRKKRDAPKNGNDATLGFEEKLRHVAAQTASATADLG